MPTAPESTPCPLCGVADVSLGPDDVDQAFWVTCEVTGATEHYLCHNDHYLEAHAEHVLSHHSPECIADAVDDANGTGAAHDDESARVVASQLLEDRKSDCTCDGSRTAWGCAICEA